MSSSRKRRAPDSPRRIAHVDQQLAMLAASRIDPPHHPSYGPSEETAIMLARYVKEDFAGADLVVLGRALVAAATFGADLYRMVTEESLDEVTVSRLIINTLALAGERLAHGAVPGE